MVSLKKVNLRKNSVLSNTATNRTVPSKMSFREKSPRRVDEENKTDEDLGDALAVCHRCDECGEVILL